MKREIRIKIDVPECWDESDYDDMLAGVAYALARELHSSLHEIEEVKK